MNDQTRLIQGPHDGEVIEMPEGNWVFMSTGSYDPGSPWSHGEFATTVDMEHLTLSAYCRIDNDTFAFAGYSLRGDVVKA